ncbi:replicative DNA helicase [Cytobacillus sp. FJAT-53684]|uniref:Replicative DNA helicase n=1 Tax=Cytobacillus mangrovibacter TaxID=3299024 RepID=A0ABW6JXQ2_9BACI
MPYYNLEAEEALVGAFFLDKDLVNECTIRPEQLYTKKLQLLLKAIQQLAEKGKPVDVISVIEEIGYEQIENIGGISYITDLACSVPTTANFQFYQEIVKEYDQKRKAIKIASRIKNEVLHGEMESVLREGIHDLMQIEDHLVDEDLGDIMPSLVALYRDCEKDLGDITGVPSGFKKLDQLTGGFQTSDLIIVGARPSVGKTAFALNIALHAAEKDIVLMFSLEMSKLQLVKRAASYIGNIHSMKMRNPLRLFANEDWTRFSFAIGKLSKKHFYPIDKAGMDIHYIYSKVRKAKRECKDEKRIVVIIDYLQLITGNPRHQSNRQAEISEISRMLKQMARELDVVVIALSQLSRGVESRQDKHPMLSDLRESGQIEQDADVIAFLYRDDYYHQDSKKKNTIEVILAKQRNGPIGTVELGFMKETGCFSDR